MTNREWALKMIPILVRWAQGAWDKPHYYSDLTAAVGHKTNQIGSVMGTIQDILDDLQKQTGKKIPTLNSLVQQRKPPHRPTPRPHRHECSGTQGYHLLFQYL